MKRSRPFLWKWCPVTPSATNTSPAPLSLSSSADSQLYSVFCVSLCRLSCTFTSMDPSGSRPSSMWPSKFRPFQQRGSIFVVGLHVEDRECRGVAAFSPRHPSDGTHGEEPAGTQKAKLTSRPRFSGQEGNNGRLCEGFYHSVNPTFASAPRPINGSYQLIFSAN